MTIDNQQIINLEQYIRIVPDFPKKGVQFKDISPLLENPQAFDFMIENFMNKLTNTPIDKILAIDSRGFIFGSVLAYKMKKPLILARKPGKLPYDTHQETYDLEYGTNSLEIHTDSISPEDNIVIVDDILATGGTIEAAIKLVKKAQGKISNILFLMELGFLNGKSKIDGRYEALLYEQ